MKSLIRFGAVLVVAGTIGLVLRVFTTHQAPLSATTLGVGIVLLIVGALSAV